MNNDHRYLYHGTNSLAWDSIVSAGSIAPRRGRDDGNWRSTVMSHPDSVYLTVAYPLHFAMHACQSIPSARGIVIEIDRLRLEEARLHADEDCIEQAMRGRDDMPHKGMKFRTKHYRAIAHMYPWLPSVNGIGNCAHRGAIPLSAVTRIASIPRLSFGPLSMVHDPSVGLLNYSVMGENYRGSVAWLFGDRPDNPMIYDVHGMGESFSRKRATMKAKYTPHRLGIKVLELNTNDDNRKAVQS